MADGLIDREVKSPTFDDLAVSLQNRLISKANNSDYQILERKIYDCSQLLSGNTITIGPDKPTRPLDAQNLHIDTTDPSGLDMPMYYRNGAWRKRVVSFG